MLSGLRVCCHFLSACALLVIKSGVEQLSMFPIHHDRIVCRGTKDHVISWCISSCSDAALQDIYFKLKPFFNIFTFQRWTLHGFMHMHCLTVCNWSCTTGPTWPMCLKLCWLKHFQGGTILQFWVWFPAPEVVLGDVCVCVGSPQLPPTVQRHAHQVDWRL